MFIVTLIFGGVIFMLYKTFGNNSIDYNDQSFKNTSNQSSVSRSNKTFDEESKTTQSSQDKIILKSSIATAKVFSQTALITSQSLPTKFSEAADQSPQIDQNIIIKPTLPQSPKLSYDFDTKDIETLSQYIEINPSSWNDNITTKINDSSENEIVVLKLSNNFLTDKTLVDFPNTFRLSNEDRLPIPGNRIILYYPKEKRVAYLGEFITDIYDFKYQDQNYWLSVYYGDLVISKPDFKDWKFVTVGENKIDQIVKKSDFEFDIISKYTYEDFDEYKKEVISPQKYIIDGLFDQLSD